MEYRLYFLAPDGRIHGASQGLSADSDAAAVEIALEMYRQAPVPHHGFELWEGKRRVYTETAKVR